MNGLFEILRVTLFLNVDVLVVDPNDVIDLIQISSQYRAINLIRMCEEFLSRQIDESNLADLLQYAEDLDLPALKKACVFYFLRAQDNGSHLIGQEHSAWRIIDQYMTDHGDGFVFASRNIE